MLLNIELIELPEIFKNFMAHITFISNHFEFEIKSYSSKSIKIKLRKFIDITEH